MKCLKRYIEVMKCVKRYIEVIWESYNRQQTEPPSVGVWLVTSLPW